MYQSSPNKENNISGENYKFAIVKNHDEFYNKNDNEFSLDINKIQNEGRKSSANHLRKTPLNFMNNPNQKITENNLKFSEKTVKNTLIVNQSPVKGLKNPISPNKEQRAKTNNNKENLKLFETLNNNINDNEVNENILKEKNQKISEEKKEKFKKKIGLINNNFQQILTNTKAIKDPKNTNKLNESFLNSSNFQRISKNLNNNNSRKFNWRISNDINNNTNNNINDSSYNLNLNDTSFNNNNISFLRGNNGKTFTIIPDNSAMDMSLALGENQYTFIQENNNNNSVKNPNNNYKMIIEEINENENDSNENEKEEILQEKNKLNNNKYMNGRGFFKENNKNNEMMDNDEENKINQMNNFKDKIKVVRKNKDLDIKHDSILDFMDNTLIFQEGYDAKIILKENEEFKPAYSKDKNIIIETNENEEDLCFAEAPQENLKLNKSEKNVKNSNNNINADKNDFFIEDEYYQNGRIPDHRIKKEMEMAEIDTEECRENNEIKGLMENNRKITVEEIIEEENNFKINNEENDMKIMEENENKIEHIDNIEKDEQIKEDDIIVESNLLEEKINENEENPLKEKDIEISIKKNEEEKKEIINFDDYKLEEKINENEENPLKEKDIEISIKENKEEKKEIINFDDYKYYEIFNENDYNIFFSNDKEAKEKELLRAKEKSLKTLYGKNLITSWKKNTKEDISQLRLGIQKNKYFKYKIFSDGKKNDMELLEKCKNLNFINGLSIYDEEVEKLNPINQKKNNAKESLNILEMDDLLINRENLEDFSNKNFNYKELKNKVYKELFNNEVDKKEINKNIKHIQNNENYVDYNDANNSHKIKALKYNENLINYLGFNENFNENNNENKIENFDIFDKRNLDDLFKNNNNLMNKEESKISKYSNINRKSPSGIFMHRDSVKDGNSFYRIFMFSLFENLILYKRIKMLAKIFLNIFFVYKDLKNSYDTRNFNRKIDIKDEDNEKFIFNKIDIIECRIIFNFVVNLMRIGEYSKAYEIIINAFNKNDGGFDKLVCGYLRLNILLFYKEINISNKDDDLKKFFTNFTYHYIEPELFNITLASIMFHIDVELFIFDGVKNKSLKTPINSGKLNFNGNFKNHQDITSSNNSLKSLKSMENISEIPGNINLVYNLESYSKFNRFENVKKFHDILLPDLKEENINLKEKENENIMIREIKKNKGTSISDNNELCNYEKNEDFDYNDFCKKCLEENIDNENFIQKNIYFHAKRIICCYECLKNKSQFFLKERLNSYLKDGCLSREYYCRDIEFENYFRLSDKEFYSIYGKSFWSEIQNWFMKNCLNCGISTDADDNHIDNYGENLKRNLRENEGNSYNGNDKGKEIFILNQSETYCGKCIMEEVNYKTKNLVILNEMEKKKLSSTINSHKNFQCDLSEAIEVLNLETTKRIEDSNERFFAQISSSCAICEDESDDNDKNSIQEGLKFILLNSRINTLCKKDQFEHFICNSCIDSYIENELKPEKTMTIKGKKGKMQIKNIYLIKFDCRFCKEVHSINHEVITDQKNNPNKCCVIY